ncbi:MAG: hypothetical protein PHF76_12615 [Bacteroidales bacterium]|nr:hypothetical protein [Bacteroidales bacterium]MDD3915476.1 hypothetical protein [Bacteroidales bacterium]
MFYEGLLYKGKNYEYYKLDYGFRSVDTKSFAIDNNFSIPVHALYKFNFNNGLSVFVATGLTTDIDVYSYSRTKTKTWTKIDFPSSWLEDINSTETEIDNQHTLFGFDVSGNNDWHSCFNLLWNFSAGVQYKGMRLCIGRELGMINLAGDTGGYDIKSFLGKPVFVTLSFK